MMLCTLIIYNTFIIIISDTTLTINFYFICFFYFCTKIYKVIKTVLYQILLFILWHFYLSYFYISYFLFISITIS